VAVSAIEGAQEAAKQSSTSNATTLTMAK